MFPHKPHRPPNRWEVGQEHARDTPDCTKKCWRKQAGWADDTNKNRRKWMRMAETEKNG